MSQPFAEALSWVPMSATLSATLGRAHEYARSQAFRVVTLEHFLLALADDPDAGQVLQASGIDIGRLIGDASAHLGHSDDRALPGQQVNPVADEALVKILDYAAAAARQSRRREINGAIVLAAIVGEGRSVAASILQAQGLTFEGAIKALQRANVAQPPAPRPVAIAPPAQQSYAPPAPRPLETPPMPVTPAAVSEPQPSVGGTAAQTNEQILANVRRRIDASRNAPKQAVTPPARPAYPSPPGSQPIVRHDVPEPSPVPPPAIEAPPIAPRAQPVAEPEPRNPEPHYGPSTGAPPSEYTGIYPEPALPREPDGAVFADAGLAAQSMGWEQPRTLPPPTAQAYPIDPVPPSRRPPPLPPSQPTPSISGSLGDVPPSPLRPKQLGAPVAPPSSVSWPAPVKPPVPSPQPVQPLDPYSFDGGIAGAPFPEPDSVPPPPLTNVPVPVQRNKVPRVQHPRPSPVEAGQLAENIPRTMKVGRTEKIEVRIAKAGMQGVGEGMQGSSKSYLHDLIVTKAMSVRLRVVDGSFSIETASPETQWLDNDPMLSTDDFASWRWNVTPQRRGSSRLQLIVSARTIASDGLAADTALPDQVFDIKVRADYGRAVMRAAMWIGLMILGGVLSKFGQNGLDTVATIWRGFE